MTLSPLTLAALRNGLVIFLVARGKISGSSSSMKDAFTLAHILQDAVSRSREGMEVRTSSNCSSCVCGQDQAER